MRRNTALFAAALWTSAGVASAQEADTREERYLAEILALDADTASDAALPWGPQWCGADALDLAAGEVVS